MFVNMRYEKFRSREYETLKNKESEIIRKTQKKKKVKRILKNTKIEMFKNDPRAIPQLYKEDELFLLSSFLSSFYFSHPRPHFLFLSFIFLYLS